METIAKKTNLWGNFFNLFSLVDSTEHFEKDTSSLVSFTKLNPVNEISMVEAQISKYRGLQSSL